MPASEAREDQRHAQIFTGLFWAGVALAPIAALMLLIGSSTGSLRAAVGVLILSVILVAVSITLRREGESIRSEIEDTVFDEIDAVRADLRDDISHAAQATHRALAEKLQYLNDQLEATRTELEASRAQVEALRHQVVPAPARSGAQRPGMPPGIVRHTETVQVTTRQTVMDPHEEGARGTTYGPRQPATHRSAAQPREESWTESRLRDQLERRRDANEPVSGERWQPSDPYVAERWSGAPADDDDRRPGVRAGDRWASVRSDERGRELRMGERRAALHSDGNGTELRIEDRWAAVRREAGLDRGRWEDEVPYRDRERGDRERGDRERRAISGSDRQEHWSDYQDDRDHGRDRDRDRYR